MDGHLTELTETVAQLSERVGVLESAAATSPQQVDTTDSGDPFWALNGLKERTSDHGEVMLVGAVTTPDGPVEWQQGRDATDLLETDWTDYAAPFAALGNPVRLELLRHILGGTHHTAGLAAMDHLGTTGQLHHHLRQLVAAGWVRQAGRGTYEIPAARVVPLMACLTAVQ